MRCSSVLKMDNVFEIVIGIRSYQYSIRVLLEPPMNYTWFRNILLFGSSIKICSAAWFISFSEAALLR